MAEKKQDDQVDHSDPLYRAASQGFAQAPTPSPTTEEVQRAMHPRDYEDWREIERAKLRKDADVKDAGLIAQSKADEEIRAKQEAASKKAAEASKERAAYQTRQMEAARAAAAKKE